MHALATRAVLDRNRVRERGFLGSWLTLLDGLKIVESDGFAYDEETAFELAAVRSSLVKLRDFPFVRKREEAGLLALHGLHFGGAGFKRLHQPLALIS